MTAKKKRKKGAKRRHSLRHKIRVLPVAEAMTKYVVAVNGNNSLDTLVDVLRDREISGVPVTEADELIGVVSRKDVFGVAGIEDLNQLTEEMMKKLHMIKVKDVMKKPIVINQKSTVKTAAAMMKDQGINRLIVVDDNLRMVGILSKTDLVKGTSRFILKKRLVTAVDEVLDILKRRGSITIDEIAEGFHIEKELVEEWAKILEEHKLVVVNYPVIGKAFLVLAKETE